MWQGTTELLGRGVPCPETHTPSDDFLSIQPLDPKELAMMPWIIIFAAILGGIWVAQTIVFLASTRSRNRARGVRSS